MIHTPQKRMANMIGTIGGHRLACNFLVGLVAITVSMSSLTLELFGQEANAAAQVTPSSTSSNRGSWRSILLSAQNKVVKIYGAGGFAGLESYQTGCLISADGLILTAWSTVLDADQVVVVSTQGQRWVATLVGIDPKLEIALLKVDATDLPFFDLERSPKLAVGAKVLAVSNLFGIAAGTELPSLLKGNIVAISDLSARRGNYASVYRGSIYVIDAMTANPGAAGGALTDWQGELAGMIGKELRDPQSNIWLNYAIPIDALRESIQAIRDGRSAPANVASEMAPEKPHSVLALGIVFIPDVLPKTPAYVDRVLDGTAAKTAGLQSDDLIIMVEQQRIDSQETFRSVLSKIDRADPVNLLVQRSNQIVAITLQVP